MNPTSRILITGSRDWWDAAPIRRALIQAAEDFPAEKHTLVHGGAAGADLIAAGLAVMLGWQTETHPANWAIFGKAAGHLRNQRMVDLGADACLAFFMPCRRSCKKPKPHDSHGATDCAKRAKAAGIPVRPLRQPEGNPA